MNVFQKCLKKEFGKHRYGVYVLMCKEELQKHPVTTENKEIIVNQDSVYQDMYSRLMHDPKEDLKKKSDQMMDALVTAFHIGRHFGFVFLFYVCASLILLGLELNLTVTLVSLGLMGICFLYKVYEFFSNKYCFIDAYLMMVYKSVLEKLTKSNENA